MSLSLLTSPFKSNAPAIRDGTLLSGMIKRSFTLTLTSIDVMVEVEEGIKNKIEGEGSKSNISQMKKKVEINVYKKRSVHLVLVNTINATFKYTLKSIRWKNTSINMTTEVRSIAIRNVYKHLNNNDSMVKSTATVRTRATHMTIDRQVKLHTSPAQLSL